MFGLFKKKIDVYDFRDLFDWESVHEMPSVGTHIVSSWYGRGRFLHGSEGVFHLVCFRSSDRQEFFAYVDNCKINYAWIRANVDTIYLNYGYHREKSDTCVQVFGYNGWIGNGPWRESLEKLYYRLMTEKRDVENRLRRESLEWDREDYKSRCIASAKAKALFNE